MESDLISRKAAIDAIDRITRTDNWQAAVSMALMDLPSAQPETHFDEWCTDCKEYDHEKHCCPRFNKVIRRTVEELKAQPKTGKWINGHWDGDSNFRIDGRGNCWYVRECSNCHEEIKGKPTNYCPNCGARMKEGEEQNESKILD